MGGAQALTYIIGLVRLKIIAILLGPNGIGLVSLYSSAMALLGTISGLGISSSGVREVVRAYSKDDAAEAARTVRILRRTCWVIGIFGWLLAIGLAQPISRWIIGSTEHSWAIALLGATLLISAVSAGQIALLQGLRRIGDMALANVLGVIVSTTTAICLYAWLGQAGIVPVLVTSALVSLGFSYWFSRRVHVASISVSWTETIDGSRRLVGLGLAFMWSGVLTAGLDMLTRSVIARNLGIEAAGIYQAAWSLSGLFAGFILGAMGADFYPRLTAAIHDKPKAIRMVNQQTEIGMLLALPGLLGTLAFAPLAMKIFYTERFLSGADLLPWLVLGVFGRVISWPLGFIQLAMGASRWFIATETVFVAVQATLVVYLISIFGAIGAAYAFALTYVLYVIGMLWVSRVLIGFRWSYTVAKTLAVMSALVILTWLTRWLWEGLTGMIASIVIVLLGGLFSAAGLLRRAKPDSIWVNKIHTTPILKNLFNSDINLEKHRD